MVAINAWAKGSRLLHSIQGLYGQKEPEVKPPPISVRTAVLLPCLYTIFFVAPFYLSPSLRVTSSVRRDSPASIKARCRAVVLVCLLSTVINVYVLAVVGQASPRGVLAVLGVYPVKWQDILKTLALWCILFAGPLFEGGVVEDGWRDWIRWSNFRGSVFDDWAGWRNYVVGPASEELVFRSFAISLFLLARVETQHILYGTPLIFGLAHVHHFNEFVIEHQGPGQSYLSTLLTPFIALKGALRSLFQLGYTWLMGLICAFIYLRTANLYSCILFHALCNASGFPRVMGRVGQVFGEEVVHLARVRGKDDDDTGVDTADGNRDSGTAETNDVQGLLSAGTPDQSLGVQWTVAYYILLVAGGVGFWYSVMPLTESERALVTFK